MKNTIKDKQNVLNELVPIFIPKRYKEDDVRTVSVNGKYKTIPTGKQFFVERYFAEAIQNSMIADEMAEKYKRTVCK
ncbi:MAG: hypothetical protein E7593_00155 [Ruminococcaceae bacterium]|nr:hypothetical protein [Oscillospiraceae bacterium]